MSLTQQEQERFERNLHVEGFSAAQQQQLLDAHVAVVGAGGLGSAALSYLVACGVGQLTLIENDVVSLSNLQRQLLYTTAHLGEPKAEIAAARLSALNPTCHIRVERQRLDADHAAAMLAGADVVVDCCDNYATRYVIDDYCRASHTPMVYGTAEQIGGQLSLFHVAGAAGYRELYPEQPAQLPVVGVLSPIVGVVGSLQALETVKLLTGVGETLAGKLLLVNGRTMQFTIIEL